MCDHKNLKTINDMLICKDCGQQLPLSFLTDRGKKETENETPAPDVQSETPPETGDEQEPEQELEQETEQESENEPEQETEQETVQEPAETDENPAENQPVEVKTDKSSSAKKPRKNAKKGA